MKKSFFNSFLIILSLAFSLQTSASPPNSINENPDSILGLWKNGEGTGIVQIYKSGDKYFGRIVWLKELNDATGKPRTDINNPDEKKRATPLKGMTNLRNFIHDGKNIWEDGNIYDPKTGNDYSCVMTLINENTLEVRGYIGVSLFGRTDVWKRQVKK